MPNTSGSIDDIDRLFHGFMGVHEDLIKQMRKMIVSSNAVDPNSFLDNFDSTQASPVQFQIQTDRPVIVDAILYAFTPVAAATLTIGMQSGKQRIIPIPSTSTNNPGFITCKMILPPQVTFTLASTGATQMYLEVMGRILSGTEWSYT